jgi:hypothetical protein
MRTGLKKFTDYTNRWKSNPIEEKKIASKAKPLSIQAVFNMASTQEGWRNVKNKNSTEKILDLELAKIVHGDPLKQIKFHKRQSEIDKVAVLLYGSDTQVRPAEVGEACFDQILTKSVL